jgi:uncharacterized protein YuzE
MFEEFAAVIKKLVVLFDPPTAILMGVFFLLLYGMIRVISNEDNTIEWWHFFSSKAADGQTYADIDKLGKIVGIIVSSAIMLIMTKHDKMDAIILGVYLAYVGGVAGYSAYLRSKQGLPPIPGQQ